MRKGSDSRAIQSTRGPNKGNNFMDFVNKPTFFKKNKRQKQNTSKNKRETM